MQARYGDGTNLPSGGVRFVKNEVEIEVRLTDGKADWISYRRAKPFTLVQIHGLLALHLPMAQWRTIGHQFLFNSGSIPVIGFKDQSEPGIPTSLESADGKLVARVWSPSGRGERLTVFILTKEREEAENRNAAVIAQQKEADARAAELKELEGL